MAGLHVSYRGRKSHFWYDCKRNEVPQVLAAHLRNWGRETVTVGGQDVTRDVPVADVVAVYGSVLADDGDGNPVVKDPEPVDVAKVLGG